MIKRAITLLLLALPFYLAAVQQAEGRSPGPMLEVFTGGATFYSDSFHGKKTANGERYNKNEFTAAHRSRPVRACVSSRIWGSDRISSTNPRKGSPPSVSFRFIPIFLRLRALKFPNPFQAPSRNFNVQL